MDDKRIKYTCYFAGFIESAPEKSGDWRNISYDSLKNPNLLIYCPVKQEAAKTGKNSVDNCAYIKGCKQGGHFDKFYEEMWKIWMGTIEPNEPIDLIETFKAMRNKKTLEGNRERDISFWGDFESVVRSDFILAYLPKDILTVGTHWEMFLAMIFKIPTYLVLPNISKTEANSTMIFGNMVANKKQIKIYYTLNEGIEAIKKDYNNFIS